jgi:ferredoxin
MFRPFNRWRGRDGDGKENMTMLRLGSFMAKFKLEIVRSECIGCELCSQTCPELFQMAPDGLSSLPGGQRVGENDEQELDDSRCSRQACDECPVTCIHLYENGEKLI